MCPCVLPQPRGAGVPLQGRLAPRTSGPEAAADVARADPRLIRAPGVGLQGRRSTFLFGHYRDDRRFPVSALLPELEEGTLQPV